MRIARLESGNRRFLGLVTDEPGNQIIDLTTLLTDATGNKEGKNPSDMMELLRSEHALLDRLEEVILQRIAERIPRHQLLDRNRVKLCVPLVNPGKIICLAGNYRAHITESGFKAPQQSDVITPQLFLKPATSMIGDGDDILVGKHNVTVGWEAELAVIIGKRGSNIGVHDAYDYVFGYMILNDISERGFNSRIENRLKRELDPFFDWLAGKWFNSFAPCGPWIVTSAEIPDPHCLEIRLWVNGQLRQQGNTGDMIFRIPELISSISSIMTLEPGDIISTGTPAGAGVGGENSLHHGDEVVCEIEGIGVLKNRVRSTA